MDDISAKISLLYYQLLGRSPDSEGLKINSELIFSKKITLEDLRNSILGSFEYLKKEKYLKKFQENKSNDQVKSFYIDNSHYLIVGNKSDKSVMETLTTEYNVYETHVTDHFGSIINDNDIVFDIGANIGIMSIAISNFCKRGKIISVEAIPENYKYLVRNTYLNSISNIFPINNAIHNQSGIVLKFTHNSSSLGSSHLSIAPNKEDVSVLTVKYDDLVKVYGRPNLIKLDIEGMEYLFLNDIKDQLMSFSHKLIIEINTQNLNLVGKVKPIDFFKLLKDIYDKLFLFSRYEDKLIEIKTYEEILNLIHPSELLHNGEFVQDLYCIR